MSGPEQPLLLPYPGLRPFDTKDQALFFGREAQIEILLRLLEDDRFLAVVGSSGCGKSSLIRAGLIPAIHEGFLLGTTDWDFVVIKPGRQPYSRLANELLSLKHFGSELPSQQTLQPNEHHYRDLLATLQKTDHGLLDVINSLEFSKPTIIVIDQFEELFAFRGENVKTEEVASRDEAAAFVKMLLRTCADANGRIWVLLTMRSDFIGDCEAFLGLPEAVSRSQFLVPRLDRSQMEEAIRLPGKISGAGFAPFTFEHGLVNRIINEAGDRPDQLPLMQHALMRTWKFAVQRSLQNTPVQLKHVDYDNAGGIAEALSRHADEAWDRIKGNIKKAKLTRCLFLLLCDVSPKGQITRRRSKVKEVANVADATVNEIDEVIRLFQADDRNFLILSGPIENPDTYIDVSHESLIRQWRTLADWLKEETKSVENYHEILKFEQRWKDRNGELLGDADLSFYFNWWERANPNPGWAERYGKQEDFLNVQEFLIKSEDEQFKKIAVEKEKKEAELRRTRLSALISGSIAALMIVGLLVYYFMQLREFDAYYNSFVKIKGVPEGIGSLTPEQVSHRTSSYKITRRGRVGPVIQMEAVNSYGKLVSGSENILSGFTNSSSSSEADQFSESRWQYVYDAQGTITHEIAFDRFGQNVRNVTYKNETDNIRIAYLIGKDGTPGPRENSCQAYVKYEYDDKGYEIFARYYDRTGQPTPGRDNAIVMQKKFDTKGNEIALLSLWRDGSLMNDDAGNAEFRLTRNELGNILSGEAYDAGGTPTMFKNEKYHRVTFHYDEFGNEIARSYFDEFSNPVNAKEGWHRNDNRLDHRGNVVDRYLWLADGRPGVDAQGCHQVKLEYDNSGNVIGTACIGTDGQAKMIMPGFSVLKNTYDDQNRLSGWSFFDIDGQPRGSEGVFRVKQEYDDDNNIKKIAYFASDGKPTIGEDGYHKVIKQFMSGREIRSEYRDVMDKPVLHKHGYAAIERGYDSQGNENKWVYLDVNNQPIIHHQNGYASYHREFDACGRVIEGRYLDEKLRLVQLNEGFAVIRKTYNSDNRVIQETYFDSYERPVSLAAGHSRLTQAWNKHGKLIEQRYFNDKLEPVLLKDRGYAALRYRYDDHNGRLTEAYFDEKGEPVVLEGGWARMEYKNDDHRRNIERAYFGKNGERVVGQYTSTSSKYHRATRKLDNRGNILELEYFGTDGQPLEVIDSNGKRYAKSIHHYDLNNEMIDAEYYDIQGNRVQ